MVLCEKFVGEHFICAVYLRGLSIVWQMVGNLISKVTPVLLMCNHIAIQYVY